MAFFGNCIFTTRLLLRKAEENDLPLLAAWSRSRAACGAFLTLEDFDLAHLYQQLASGALWNDKEKYFIVDRRDGGPIGCIHYWTLAGQRDTAGVSVKIAQASERNKGYGTETQKFIVKHLMENESIRQVLMYTDINNLPQQRCLYKLGFEVREALRYQDRHVMRDGLLFALSAEAFACQPIYRFHNE